MGHLRWAWAKCQISVGVLPRKGNEGCGGMGSLVGWVIVDGFMVFIRTPAGVGGDWC